KNHGGQPKEYNEYFSAKKHVEDVSFNEVDDTYEREQGEEEASGSESEISKFSETSRANKQTFAVLAKGKVFFCSFSLSFCCNLENGAIFVGSPLTNCYVDSVLLNLVRLWHDV
ncbi:hypothetical protein ACROYT_G000142, partial [Oculina patagonica]